MYSSLLSAVFECHLSGAAPIHYRFWKKIENTIIGRHLDETIAASTNGSDDGRTTFAPNEYKMPLYRGIIEADLLAAQKVCGVLQP